MAGGLSRKTGARQALAAAYRLWARQTGLQATTIIRISRHPRAALANLRGAGAIRPTAALALVCGRRVERPLSWHQHEQLGVLGSTAIRMPPESGPQRRGSRRRQRYPRRRVTISVCKPRRQHVKAAVYAQNTGSGKYAGKRGTGDGATKTRSARHERQYQRSMRKVQTRSRYSQARQSRTALFVNGDAT